jgi:hypothetical protein
MTETSLRGFLGRILGWSNAPAVDNALRSIRLSASHRAALVLLGDANLVPIAHALHRRALGPDRPFIVCDPRRRSARPATIRSSVNHERGVVAFRAAIGGSLCLRQRRTPADLPALAMLVRSSGAPVQIIVLAEARYDLHPFLLRPAPIRVPHLSTRTREISRIVDEYMRDAIMALDAGAARFTDDDRKWVRDHASTTLAEIEKATLRLVAMRLSSSVTEAAERLGMSHVALSQWLDRRGSWKRGTIGRRPGSG